MASRKAVASAEACARLLFQARTKGFRLYDIPATCRPQNVHEGYESQTQLIKLLGRKRIGFKVANTNETSQKFLNLNELFFGPLLESELVGKVGTRDKPAQLKGMSKLSLRLCEPEFAFLLGDDKKIVAVAPAIEIVHSRFLDWKGVGAPTLIADLACNGAWVRGEAVDISKVKLDGCVLRISGKEFAQGKAERVLGSPFNVFENLCAQKHIFDQLVPGDWITTGVCVDPPYHYCAIGDDVEADFDGGLGTVALKCLK